jgi:hypothetical protein
VNIRSHRSARISTATVLALFLPLVSLPSLGTTGAAIAAKTTPNDSAGAATVSPELLAQRLCAVLHALPEERKAQCCSTAPSSTLAAECTGMLSAALRDRTLRLDAAAIGRCAADSSRAFAGCDWVTPLVPPSPGSCHLAVQGLAPAGASCRTSLECQDGLSCRGGSCAKPAPPGAACGGSVDTLATFLRQTDLAPRHPECAGYCLAGRCAAFSAPEAACFSSRQCAPGRHCAGGSCKDGAFASLGEPCTGTSCGPDAFCQGGKCSALKSANASCSSPFECKGACLVPAGASSGTCGMKCSNWPLPATEGERGTTPKPGSPGAR